MVRRRGPLRSLQKTPVALVLTGVAGFVDVFGYIFIYGIYVAHMSGNTVAAARHIVDLQWYGFLRHSWPIFTFIIGLVIGAIMFEAQTHRRGRLPVAWTLLAETLLIAVFIPMASGIRLVATVPPQPAARFYPIVALLTFAMAMQNVTIRKVGGLNVYTTFVTGSLVKFAEATASFFFWVWRRTRRRFRARAGKVARIALRQRDFLHMMLTGALFVSYIAGACFGALIGLRYQIVAIFIPLAILIALTIYSAIRPFVRLPEEEW
jgi:uncharacterized membrane protein YoaK (UPF0700 family)